MCCAMLKWTQLPSKVLKEFVLLQHFGSKPLMYHAWYSLFSVWTVTPGWCGLVWLSALGIQKAARPLWSDALEWPKHLPQLGKGTVTSICLPHAFCYQFFLLASSGNIRYSQTAISAQHKWILTHIVKFTTGRSVWQKEKTAARKFSCVKFRDHS